MAKRTNFGRFAPIGGGILVIALVGLAVYEFVQSTGGVQAPQAPEVQQISLVVPPPPPPPPPLEEPPPEPEIEQVEVPTPEPEPSEDIAESDEPAPGDELGLDADGVAGADGFGLKAKKGARGLIGGGSGYLWYANIVQKDLQSTLASMDAIRQHRYSVEIKIWLAPDGTIETSELVRGSGDSVVDEALMAALGPGLSVSREPPEDLPQPIRLRITSRI